jgi:hypothetical protein
MDRDEYADIVRRLAAMMYSQHERNLRMDVIIEELRDANRQQAAVNRDVAATLSRMEALMQRVFGPQGGNGHEADHGTR